MDSRNILAEDKRLKIVLDTDSIDEIWGRDDVRRILRHADNNDFDFMRTPGDADNDAISAMKVMPGLTHPALSSQGPDNLSNVFGLDENRRKLLALVAPSNLEDANSTNLLAVSQRFIILTADDDLLSNRLALEQTLGLGLYGNSSGVNIEALNVRLNIATPKETIELMGLSKRKIRRYGLGTTDLPKERWLHYMMLLRLPHLGYNVNRMSLSPRSVTDKVHLGAIKSRATYLLEGLDQVGFQYYSGIDIYPTSFDIAYHVDYCISLITGALDNLAHYANDELGIGLDEEKVSLTTSRPFISEVRSQGHTNIADYIHDNHAFADIAYKIRNGVVHREGIVQESKSGRGGTFVEVNGEQIESRLWSFHKADLTRLGDDYVDVARKYSQLNDSPLDYDPITEWGLFSANVDENADRAIFEPYQMLKMMTDRLFEYIDDFLRIMGHENVIDQMRNGDNTMLDSVNEMDDRALTPFVLDSLR